MTKYASPSSPASLPTTELVTEVGFYAETTYCGGIDPLILAKF